MGRGAEAMAVSSAGAHSVPRELASKAVEGAGTAHPATKQSGRACTAHRASKQPEGACTADPSSDLLERAAAGLRRLPTATRSGFRDRGRPGRRRRDCHESMRKFGDNLSLLNSNVRCSRDFQREYEMSCVDSFGNSLSSSDKENLDPSRNRIMDDALFMLFRKEAVKSLKRGFSTICNDSEIWQENKRCKEHTFCRDDFSSYSIKYFWEVLKSLSTHRKEVIRKFGFGCLLNFRKTEIPSVFVRWIACSVDPVSSQIIVDGSKIIPISKHSVFHVIGLPNSGTIPLPDSDRGVKFILSVFGLKELPHITFFGNKLASSEVLSDREIFVAFIAVAFKCFLFPSIGDYPNTDYLYILEDPDAASGFDICEIVYEYLISGITKFNNICKLNGRKPKTFEFCHYFLSVYYLDSLDFGARLIDQSVPRISVWNGNMVKFFSDLDHIKKKLFGKRQLKKKLPHCYREFGLLGDFQPGNDVSYGAFELSCFSDVIKQNLHLEFGSSLESKVINGIIDSVQAAAGSRDDYFSKFHMCAINVLNFLKAAKLSDFIAPLAKTTAPALEKSNHEPVKSEGAGNLCVNNNNIIENGAMNTDFASKLDVLKSHTVSHALRPKSVPVHYETPECVITKEVQACNVSAGLDESNHVAAKPDVVDPHTVSRAFSTTSALLHHESADCMITKEIHPPSISTAPAMDPMKKFISKFGECFQARRTYPAGVKSTMSLLYPDFSKNNGIANSVDVVRNISSFPISRINFSESPNEKGTDHILQSCGKVSAVPFQKVGTSHSDGTNAAPIRIDSSPKPDQFNKYPEVEITCVNKFSSRQAEMSKSVDAMYNSMINQGFQTPPTRVQNLETEEEYIDLSNHAVEERTAKDELIVLQPKKDLILPLIPNRRFPVSNSEIKNFRSIVDLAYTLGIQKKYAVMYSKVHCSYITLGQSLMREGHVDNFLIPLFCRKLFEDNHPSKSKRHHFFSMIGESILDYNNGVQLELITKALLGAASASRGKRLELSDTLFFPICRSRHWFTFGVDFKYKLFMFLDSLFSKDDFFHTSIKYVLINNFVKVWKLAFNTNENIFKNFGIVYPNVPKQDNPDDCGIFTMKFMEVFRPEVDTRTLFSMHDIVHIRIQYANQIYFCPRNQANKSYVLEHNPED